MTPTPEQCIEQYVRLRGAKEAREKALVDWYGRQAKHHLADTELLPSERRARTAASHRADFEAR